MERGDLRSLFESFLPKCLDSARKKYYDNSLFLRLEDIHNSQEIDNFDKENAQENGIR